MTRTVRLPSPIRRPLIGQSALVLGLAAMVAGPIASSASAQAVRESGRRQRRPEHPGQPHPFRQERSQRAPCHGDRERRDRDRHRRGTAPALIVNANGNKVGPEEMDCLRLQVLRNLIDENAADPGSQGRRHPDRRRRGEPDVRARGHANFGQSCRRWKSTSPRSARRPPRSSARSRRAFVQRLLRRNVQPFINISDGEVREMMERLQRRRDPRNTASAKSSFGDGRNPAAGPRQRRKDRRADQAGRQLRCLCRQFSEASTAAVGGDLGWIRLGQLPQRTGRGRDRHGPGPACRPDPDSRRLLDSLPDRQAPGADRRPARCRAQPQADLDRVSKGTTEKQAADKAAGFASMVKSITAAARRKGRCDDRRIVVANDQIKARDLPVRCRKRCSSSRSARQPAVRIDRGRRARAAAVRA